MTCRASVSDLQINEKKVLTAHIKMGAKRKGVILFVLLEGKFT